MHAIESYSVYNIDKNSYAMHTIKITANLLFEYQCTSGKFISLANRIEKIDSVARIESKVFLPELECSATNHHLLAVPRFRLNTYDHWAFSVADLMV